MSRGYILLASITLVGLFPGFVVADAEVIEFTDQRWDLSLAVVGEYQERPVLRGTAWLKDVEFHNGVIEVDVAVDGSTSYPGFVFRKHANGEYERLYLRPHRAGRYPDAVQYAPVFHGTACWQIYSGDGISSAVTLPTNEWVHLRLEVRGTQARLFVGEAAQPTLEMHDLKHGDVAGAIGLMGPLNMSACFSNFSFRETDELEFAAPPELTTPNNMLTDWELSQPFPAGQVDRESYPSVFQLFRGQKQTVTAEPPGLINISRYAATNSANPQYVLARKVVYAKRPQTIRLSIGYSDEVTVFLNGRPVFTGQSAYRSRDPSFVGIMGLNDAVHLPLEKGLNEIGLLVTDTFGGWGFMCRSNRKLAEPIKQHDRLTKVWETPAEFLVPESVQYDAQRQVLYVTSFNRAAGGNQTGFISKLTLDGEITELKWITGLDGPCGMGIHGDTLYVAESSGNLVAVDIPNGSIKARYPTPGSSFINDISVAPDGMVYASNSSRAPHALDLYTFDGEECKVWQRGSELHRCNGIYVVGDDLIVSSNGHGLLKRVRLTDGSVSTITSLGAGIIDGIRTDNAGNYLVSHWSGRAYSITPTGEVVEILDTTGVGENCADFEFVKERNLLVVPTFTANKVTAYRLDAR